MRRCLTVSLVILLLVAAVGGGCEWYTARAVAAYRQALLPVEAAMAADGWLKAQALAESVATPSPVTSTSEPTTPTERSSSHTVSARSMPLTPSRRGSPLKVT